MNYLHKKQQEDDNYDPISLFQYVMIHSGEKE